MIPEHRATQSQKSVLSTAECDTPIKDKAGKDPEPSVPSYRVLGHSWTFGGVEAAELGAGGSGTLLQGEGGAQGLHLVSIPGALSPSGDNIQVGTLLSAER